MRLRRSDPNGPGLSRRRRGRGFSFHGPDGQRVSAADEERIRELAIPPAWGDVWVAPDPRGHLQATGIDDAGRRQYLYHQEWRRQRDRQKHDRVLTMVPRLPDFRTIVEQQLGGRGWHRDRTLAVALRMLDHGVFRTGGEEYAEQNGSYGVSTLQRSQVRVRGNKIIFEYPAKSGISRRLSLHDPPLAHAVRCLQRLRTDTERLLVFRSSCGMFQLAHPDDLNVRFKELTGGSFTVKDLRTWHATVSAAAAIAEQPRARSTRAARRTELSVLRQVAAELGNTAAVARKSYVDPRIFDLYEHGDVIDPALHRRLSAEPADRAARRALDEAVLRLLES